MSPANLSWHERRSDSTFIESVWTCRALERASRPVIADPCICLSLVNEGEDSRVVVAGPKMHPTTQLLSAGSTWTTIRLTPGVSLKNIDTSELVDSTLSIPADNTGRFKLNDETFHFPDYEHAERLIVEFFASSQLTFRQPQNVQALPRRTHSRQMKRFTGLSPYKLQQLQRMHQALRLLKNGASVADVVVELNFTDQAHFSHASKQFFGYTPAKLKELMQSP